VTGLKIIIVKSSQQESSEAGLKASSSSYYNILYTIPLIFIIRKITSDFSGAKWLSFVIIKKTI